MAGRFELIFDEHWSKAHVKATREAGFLRFLEELAAEEAPFAGIIRFVTPEEK